MATTCENVLKCLPSVGAVRKSFSPAQNVRSLGMPVSSSLSLSKGRSTCNKPSKLRRYITLAVEEDGSETSASPSSLLDRSNPILQETYMVVDTGRWECRSCGFVYNQDAGDSTYPIAAGTEFKNLPEDWRCPTCGSAQSLFQSKSKEVAGFAQNQSYGLGGNSLTTGQKSLLIWGSLLAGFVFFMSGYLLE